MSNGKFDEVKGRVKEAAGDLTGDDELAEEGERDQAAGKAKQLVDDVKDKANEVIDGVKDKLDRN